jgi:4-hydroxy-2-oxoheptanedioate aldolase
VIAAIEDAIRRVVASGKAAGTLMTDNESSRRALELGATFVATGVDVLLYAAAARTLAQDFIAPR